MNGMDVTPTPAEPLAGGHPLRSVSLQEYERAGAGHALARHVHDENGQFSSDAARLAADPFIPASGGFTDAATAQRSVDDALTRGARRIAAWRRTATRFTPFIAEVALGHVNGHNLSRELFDRGIVASIPTTGVRIVLMPDDRFACGFAVLTAYNVAVPPPPSRVHSFPALSVRNEDGSDGALAVAAQPPDAQFASGVPTAVRFVSADAARRTVAAGVAAWSAEIDAWLADGGAAETFTRAFVGPRTVGHTWRIEERDAGVAEWTATPTVLFTLCRFAAAPSGFVVSRAVPSRSF